jgi:hypothetical protein
MGGASVKMVKLMLLVFFFIARVLQFHKKTSPEGRRILIILVYLI